jgi:hypothetical protein
MYFACSDKIDLAMLLLINLLFFLYLVCLTRIFILFIGSATPKSPTVRSPTMSSSPLGSAQNSDAENDSRIPGKS